MPRTAWIVAGILTTIVALGILGLSSWVKIREATDLRSEIERLQQVATKGAEDSKALQSRVQDAEEMIAKLAKEKEDALQNRKSLEKQMRAALESKDVTISQLQGKLTVNILDRVLFDSGQADLKPEGEAILRKVAEVLAQQPDVKIHVIGHTDNVPIRSTGRNRYASNWELSTARATAAVRFLSETAGVSAARLGAVGYGEFRPVADNSTPEGRAKNRRIAITLLSDELAGADPASPASTNASPASGTAAPPDTNASPASASRPQPPAEKASEAAQPAAQPAPPPAAAPPALPAKSLIEETKQAEDTNESNTLPSSLPPAEPEA
jgi:chemotaxis protein MotB